jgi:maltooligosyltrehalose synthase
MASNLNSEFNYRYQVIGSTPWEKIKTLQGFLVGRKRAAVLEECAELKYQAKLEELNHLRSIPAAKHLILNLRAEILELESHLDDQKHAFELNRKEIKILEKLMAELYMEVEPTRLKHEDGTPYTDDEMFEANANYEFTVTVGREIQAEIIANGRPSPAKLLNAMSNPQTLESLKLVGLVPNEATLLTKTDVVGLIGNSTAELNTPKGISQ